MAFYEFFLNNMSNWPMFNIGYFPMLDKTFLFPNLEDFRLNKDSNYNISCFWKNSINNSWANNYELPNLDTFTPSTYTPKEYDWASSMGLPSSNPPKKKKVQNHSLAYNSKTDIYATQNAEYIKNLTNEMQERTKKLIAYANKNGYDVEISSGYRTEQRQKELQEEYKNEPGRVAEKSAHCAGKAIDIKVSKNGQESEAGYNLLGKYAKSELGMRWGGDFTSYRERWHFDYDWA